MGINVQFQVVVQWFNALASTARRVLVQRYEFSDHGPGSMAEKVQSMKTFYPHESNILKISAYVLLPAQSQFFKLKSSRISGKKGTLKNLVQYFRSYVCIYLFIYRELKTDTIHLLSFYKNGAQPQQFTPTHTEKHTAQEP